jgi:DNA-binding XRE family transcriptional regulator
MPDGKQIQGRVLLDGSTFDRLTSERGWDTDAKRAKVIGISTVTIYRLRKGHNSPSGELVFSLPELLGVRPEVLFYREGSES